MIESNLAFKTLHVSFIGKPSFCLSLNFLSFLEIEPEIYLSFESNIDLISIFGQQKLLTLELVPCNFCKIFLGIWPLEFHFLINFSLIKKKRVFRALNKFRTKISAMSNSLNSCWDLEKEPKNMLYSNWK